MPRYLLEAERFFRGTEQFEIDAENKADAVEKGKEYVISIGGGNYILSSVRCVRKIKPAKKTTHC